MASRTSHLFLGASLLALTPSACGGDSGGDGGRTSALAGVFYGLVGTTVTLQNNGADALDVNIPPFPGSSDPYSQAEFSFPRELIDGAAYEVTVSTAPAGNTCSVYAGASGVMPVAEGTVRVGCELTVDKVSRDSSGTVSGTFFDSQNPVIGGSNEAVGATTVGYGEGRFVAFVSSAAMAGSSGAHRQVFWRDRFTNEIRLVSANVDGTEGNGDSGNPAISADGLGVAFDSYATNLVTGDLNGVRDVFVWNANGLGPNMTRVSVGAGNVEYAFASGNPSLNGDATVIAFETQQGNLTVTGDGGTAVMRTDLRTGTTKLISATSMGNGVDAYWPMLSEDGQRVVFYSFQSSLVASDSNGLWDIFVYDVPTNVMKRVSLSAGGGERNQGTESTSRSVAPAISGDGRWVAYTTTASNVVPNDTNGLQDVFVVDTTTGAVTRASVATNGAQGDTDTPIGQGERVALSYDGTWIAFNSTANTLGVATTTTGLGNVFLHNRVTGETRPLTNNTTCCTVGSVSMSRNANYVAFGSGAPLDPARPGSGLFVRFTNASRGFYWLED